MALQQNFFTSQYIFNSHDMLINTYTKEFTITNNAFLSYAIAFEQNIVRMPMFTKILTILKKKHEDIFHFNLSIVYLSRQFN